MSPFVRRPTVRHADRVLARSAMALVLAVFTATFAGLAGNPAGELSFQSTRSMAHGRLSLGDTPEARLLVAASRGTPASTLPLHPGAGERSGEDYSCLGLGHAALGLPFYGLGWALGLALPELEARHTREGYHGREGSELLPHLAVGWRNPLLTAWTVWLLVLVVRRLGASRSHAWMTGLTYGLTTFAWPQARGSLPEVSSTFLLLLAFHLTLRARERFERLEVPRAFVPLTIGIALGLAWVTHAGVRPAVLVLTATAEIVLARGFSALSASRWSPRGDHRRGGSLAVGSVLVPLVLAALGLALLDYLRFGVWVDPCGLAAMFGGEPVAGAGELLVSPGRGLLWSAPLVLLVPMGLRRAHNMGERLFSRTLVALILALLLPALAMPDGSGRWSFGPRPLLPLLPFLWVAVGLAWPWVAERAWRGHLALGLGLLGFLVQFPAALVDEATYVDLARQAASSAWGEEQPPLSEDDLWERCAWDWNFAAPWVHWRILRHRVAGLGESFSARDLFRLDSDATLVPGSGRARQFNHLGWVDLKRRLGAGGLAGMLSVLTLFLMGVVAALRGLDPGKA
jgi:hypothetical protein